MDYAKVYLFLDPIIKKNPKIIFSELEEKHPEVAKEISRWSFNARKSMLAGRAYGSKSKKKAAKKSVVKKISKKKKRKYVRKVTVATDNEIVEAIEKIVPSTRRKKEYIKIGKILMYNPNTIYSHLKKTGKIKMCDANFYQFRRKFCAMLGLSLTAPSVNSGSNRALRSTMGLLATKQPAFVTSPKKRATIYTVLYERESNGCDTKAKELVTEIFEALQREKIANLEMIELVHPNRVLEIRSYAK